MSVLGQHGGLLVVGLGNPGAELAGTRHNVGAEVVELLARRNGVALKEEKGTFSRLVVARPPGGPLVLAVPGTYMNDSGLAVRALAKRYELEDLSRLVVVHDELDLPVGTVRVKSGGGTAGHNGLRSIESQLKTLDFLRVRIGIGKPLGRSSGVEHVLRRPGKAERGELEVAIEEAADAVELLLGSGPEAAMNTVNAR